MGWRTDESRFVSWQERPKHPDWFCDTSTPLFDGHRKTFPASKVTETYISSKSTAEVRNAWIYTSTYSYDFMTWCLIMNRDKSTTTSAYVWFLTHLYKTKKELRNVPRRWADLVKHNSYTRSNKNPSCHPGRLVNIHTIIWSMIVVLCGGGGDYGDVNNNNDNNNNNSIYLYINWVWQPQIDT